MDKEQLKRELGEILTYACKKQGGRGYVSEVWNWSVDGPDDASASLKPQYELKRFSIYNLIPRRRIDAFHEHLLKLHPRYKEPYGVGGLTTRLLEPKNYLWFLVEQSFEETERGFKHSLNRMSDAAEEFWRQLEWDRVQATFLATLRHFYMESDELVLPDAKIRKLTEDEFRELYNEEFVSDREHCHFAVVGSLSRRLLFGEAAERRKTSDGEVLYEQLLEPVLKAFHLMGPGDVLLDDIIFRPEPPNIHPGPYSIGLGTRRGRGFYRDFVLEREEEGRFLTLVSKLQKKKHKGEARERLAVAMNRLAMSRTEDQARYRLLDAVTALEILLLPAKEGSIKTRFVLHYACLGDTPRERHARRRQASALYNLRSVITHGGEVEYADFQGCQQPIERVAEAAAGMVAEIVEKALLDGGFKFWDQRWWYTKLLGPDKEGEASTSVGELEEHH